MNLSKYIIDNLEPILKEWENFAKTKFPVNQQDNVKKLRDHAKSMLLKIAEDLEHHQSSLEQVQKSKGNAHKISKQETPATLHGADRMEVGLDINDVISEFRALRASVIKFFTDSNRKILLSDPYDLVRFNEAIDQALTESINKFVILTEIQRDHFNKLLSDTLDFNYILDLNGNITYMNKAMSTSYEVPVSKILGKAIYNNRMPSKEALKNIIQSIIKTGNTCEGELNYLDSSGKSRYTDYSLDPIYDIHKKIKAIAGVSHDITKEKETEAAIWDSANYDSLTGCPNKQMLLNKLDDVIKNSNRSKKTLAVLFVDLDHFKDANDKWGHDYGDWLLKQIAKRIKACVRSTDIVARLGGDEFAVALIDIQNDVAAQMITENILTQLRKPFQHQKKKINISASIGIMLSSEDTKNPNTLLSNADQAMYVAKNSGRDQFHFFDLDLPSL
jgi:diguanylate cyclase (GGDEF)-like protein/PAS domain S-box-containing protein